ncbi:glycosyltransferase family 4 protein [Verrucomicrobiota bacterium]
MDQKKTIIVLGQTPPPFNGQAKMIAAMLDGLKDEFDLIHIRMAYSISVAEAGKFRFGKFLHLFALIARTWVALIKHRGAVLYYPPGSPNLVPMVRDLLFLAAVRPLAGRCVLHFHAGGQCRFAEKHKLLGGLLRLVYGRADAVIIQGKSVPPDGSYFRAKRILTVPNGVNVPGRSDSMSSVMQRTRGSETFRILYVGIHTEGKGLFDLLETARVLKETGLEFRIHTVGRWYAATEEERFLQQRRESGLDEYVFCQGRKTGDDLWREYAEADVFFFPTFYEWETQGVVLLEAMAFGLPVVASKWQGPLDVVDDGKTGLLCPVHGNDEFAHALKRLAEDDVLYRQMSAYGRARYLKTYTNEVYVGNLKQAFKEIIL